jgi:hypothetical protein
MNASGNRVALGIPDFFTNEAVFQVFEENNNSWEQIGSDIILDNPIAFLAVSLSSSGNTLAIGNAYSEVQGEQRGRVEVYEFDGNDWIQKGSTFLGNAFQDEFGYDVEISGDGNRLIIGAPYENISQTLSGIARVYDFDGTAWIQVGNNINQSGLAGYGVSISEDGQSIAVGSPSSNISIGQVKVYTFDGTAWVQKGQNILGDNTKDFLGANLSLSSDGSIVAVSLPTSISGSSPTNPNGKVRIFKFEGNDWVQMGTDLIGEFQGDSFGSAIALSANGKRVVVGSGFNDELGQNSGHVRLFDFDGSDWVQLGDDIDGNGDFLDDLFGRGVAISADGNRFIAGAWSGSKVFDISNLSVCDYSIPEVPMALVTEKEFCNSSNLVEGLAETGIRVENSLNDYEKVVWHLVNAPNQSNIIQGTHFTIDDCDQFSNIYANVVVEDHASVLYFSNVEELISGDYIFEAYIENCETGCISDVAGPFTISVFPIPTLATCPSNQVTTLSQNPNTDGCNASFSWLNPSFPPSPCAAVSLNIQIGDDASISATPGVSNTLDTEELGTTIVTYDLMDPYGTVSTCSFELKVEGLPCDFSDSQGIGCNSGNTTYEVSTNSYILDASDCTPAFPNTSDQTAFVYAELCGNGEIVARVDQVDGNGFAGIMMRNSEAADDPKVAIASNLVNAIRKEIRVLAGYPAYPQNAVGFDRSWLKLIRNGNQFIGQASTDGINWQTYISQAVMMSNDCILVGMYTSSEVNGGNVIAQFDQVTITENSNNLNTDEISIQLGQASMTSESSWNVFPNPAKDLITIDLQGLPTQVLNFEMYNALGQSVKRFQLDKNNGNAQIINIQGLETGVYSLMTKIEHEIISKRILINQ